MSHVYKVRYSLEPGQFSKDDLKDSGGCDQILLCSYVESSDGSGSYAWLSSNGELPHQEMDADRQMKCLMVLVNQLSEDENLKPSQRRFLEAVFESYRAGVLSSREHRP
jgi:hypothetical protein